MSAMNEPFVTVIMPIRNEEAFITHSLGAVLNQDYPSDRVEILIADGMSNDKTREVIQSLHGADRVRIVPNKRRIQAAGMNEALNQARGDYVIRVDGHTVIASDYVRQCIATLQITGAQNVGGPIDPVGITPMGRAIAAAGKSSFAVPSVFHISQQAQYTDTVYLGAWPKQVFVKVGGFNEQFAVNEDYELNYRIHKAGGKIYFTPQIRSQYFGRQTLNALAKQYFRYGRSKIKTLSTHPGSVRLRHLVAPAFVLYLISLVALFVLNASLTGALLIILLAYFALNLFFSARVARWAGWILLWRLPIVFLTIHLAWGLGFWFELVWRAIKG